MAVVNPPYVLQAAGIEHVARLFRRALFGHVFGTPGGQDRGGVVSAFNLVGSQIADLEVAEDSPSGMSVRVNRGGGFVVGDVVTDQGAYFIYNDDFVARAIPTADPSNPRIDLVVARVHDATEGGTGDEWDLEVVQGTPAPSPAAPSRPDSSMELAHVLVGAGATSILNADVTDVRRFVREAQGVGAITTLHRASTQNIAHNSATTISFTSVQLETDPLLLEGDTGGNRIIVKQTRLYEVGVFGYWDARNGGRRFVRAFVNGSTTPAQIRADSAQGSVFPQVATFPMMLNAGDEVTMQVIQGSGTNLRINNATMFVRAL